MASAPSTEILGSAPPPVSHVLHVVDRDVVLRFGPMLAQVLPSLCAAGVRTTLVSDDPAFLARLEHTPIERLSVPHLAGWRAWTVPSFLTGRVSPAPSLVHLWGTAGLWWTRRWTRQAGIPLLVHALGVRHIERLAAGGRRHREHVLFAANGLAVQWRRLAPAAPAPRVVPAGVAPPPVPLDHRPLEREAEGRVLTVLCVAEFAERAGLTVLVEAVGQLRRRGADLHTLVIGSGPGSEVIWSCISEQGAAGSVSLLDEPALWEKALPEVDVCVVPACQRELSIVPLLAMGLGKVVIASRDQLADWFVDGTTCWEFTPGSAVELAYLLTRAIEQPAVARELAARGPAYVREQHSLQHVLESLWTVYTDVANEAAAVGKPHDGPVDD